MLSIDPLRRSATVRRSRPAQTESRDDTPAAETANLPVVTAPARTLPPGPTGQGGQTALHAQAIGERRGLRAGPSVHGEARASYSQVEWSGSWDRRRRAGATAKQEI